MTIQASDLIKEVDLGGVKYRVAMASAKDQRSVMFLLAHYGLEGALSQVALAKFRGGDADMAALGIMATLMAKIPESDFNRILDLILSKVFLVEGGAQVTLNHFQGRMQDYVKLGVLALGVNFADFTGLLSLFQRSTDTTEDQETEDQTSTQESTGISGESAPE